MYGRDIIKCGLTTRLLRSVFLGPPVVLVFLCASCDEPASSQQPAKGATKGEFPPTGLYCTDPSCLAGCAALNSSVLSAPDPTRIMFTGQVLLDTTSEKNVEAVMNNFDMEHALGVSAGSCFLPLVGCALLYSPGIEEHRPALLL